MDGSHSSCRIRDIKSLFLASKMVGLNRWKSLMLFKAPRESIGLSHVASWHVIAAGHRDKAP